MKTQILIVAMSTMFSIGVMGQNNDQIFKSENDYKHPYTQVKENKTFANATYVKPGKSTSYKQQNNTSPKEEGVVVKSDKKQKNWNALNNPNNYKTQR